MSVKPIPLRLAHTPPPVEPQLVAVEATIDYLMLPTARPPITRADGVHVVVADGEQLARWMHDLGGELNRAPALDGASLWTLRTQTPARSDGSSTPILVHVALVHDEFVPAKFRGAESA
ncbi:hypothetical protein ABZ330_21535 [Streptomyces sp. NPDC006172]|uniref:hypothetical protein n=1 Tax=Streptomyces sp. NPDC006172 TaxID=3154470 RepID=UPI0033F50CB3